jgi:hypothetical protein
MDTAAAQTQQADIQLDTGGVWYQNALYASIGHDAMYDTWWWNDDIWGGTFDHRPLALGPTRLLSGLPINNGNYVDVAATVTSGLRAIGQKDLTNKRGYAWVQNQSWTWRNVIDKVSITPITGTIQIAGLSNSTLYTISTYTTSTGLVSGTAQILTNGSGTLTIPVTSLSSDTAFRFQEGAVAAISTQGTVKFQGRTKQ